jgi:hypothetical protein
MLNFISIVRPYVEVAYFAAGILLAFGLIFTFHQITLIKKDINLRNERASKEHAIDACTRYFQDFVPKVDAYSGDLRKAKLPRYKEAIGDFSSASISKDFRPFTIKRMNFVSVHLCLNELEVISACFTTGVADEKTGFLIIGRTFCVTVETYYDVIAACRDQNAHPYWHNITRLYQIWRPRLTKAEMKHTLQELENKIHSLGTDSTIDAIGTS